MSDSPLGEALRAIDALDLDALIGQFAPQGTVLTSFGEEATGREAVRAALGAFFNELRATHHEVSAEWNPEPGVWIAESSATYELSDFSRRGPYRRALILWGGEAGIEQLHVYGAHELPLPDSGGGYAEVRGPHGWLPTL